MNNNEKDMILSRGNRIKYIREVLLGYKRKEFAEKHRIKIPTLKVWENGQLKGLSEDGASLLSKCFRREGIACTKDWLLHGSEPKPYKLQGRTILSNSDISDKTLSNIKQELEFFYKINKDVIHYQIKDNSMEPRLHNFDFIAGIKLLPNNYDDAIGRLCIVTTLDGKIYVRLLQKDGDKYRLFITNPEDIDIVNEIHLAKEDIISIAPIIWIRSPY